jgi:hypothetical protein
VLCETLSRLLHREWEDGYLLIPGFATIRTSGQTCWASHRRGLSRPAVWRSRAQRPLHRCRPHCRISGCGLTASRR